MQLYDDQQHAWVGDPSMIDISLSGMCVEASVPMQVGVSLNFRVTIPKSGSVTGIAKVCWSKPDRTGKRHLSGLKFETLGWANQRALRNYLQPYTQKRAREQLD